MSQGCQTKVQNCFSNTFGKWADMVSNRTTIVFCCSLVVFLGLGKSKMKLYKTFLTISFIFFEYSRGYDSSKKLRR